MIDALWGEGKPNGAQLQLTPLAELVTKGNGDSRADPTPGLLPASNELQLGPSSDIQGAALLLGHGLIWGGCDSQPTIHAKARADHGFPQSCQSRCGALGEEKKPKSK